MLWPFQTIIIKGRRYCWTHLGFGLNVAPLIMKVIVKTVLEQDELMKKATSVYVDDIYVNEDELSVDEVKSRLESFGLASKDSTRLRDGVVLGLKVWGEHNTLQWKWGNLILELPVTLMRHTIFSICGKLVGYFPVCGWLHAATEMIKRQTSMIMNRWHDTEGCLSQANGDWNTDQSMPRWRSLGRFVCGLGKK